MQALKRHQFKFLRLLLRSTHILFYPASTSFSQLFLLLLLFPPMSGSLNGAFKKQLLWQYISNSHFAPAPHPSEEGEKLFSRFQLFYVTMRGRGRKRKKTFAFRRKKKMSKKKRWIFPLKKMFVREHIWGGKRGMRRCPLRERGRERKWVISSRQE